MTDNEAPDDEAQDELRVGKAFVGVALAGRSEEIGKEKPVIFQCRLGARSGLATQAFRAAGYDAYNMTGGILAWADAGLPLEPEGGTVAEH